ncbi:unnamed protein product, partial [Allacma fusca]
PDGISGEFLKSLPENFMRLFLQVFNQIIEGKTPPRAWGDIELVMLYKKGDLNDPGNYRGISLISHGCKWFTQILLDRLNKWCEESGIMCETQAGFRKTRGCEDLLFTRNSIVNDFLYRKAALYVAYVDYEKAFDSVEHDILWSKLFNLGISGQMVRTIKNLYEHAGAIIRLEKGFSKKININCGVLQGELLSPLMFNLFTNDFEAAFSPRNCITMKLSSTCFIHSLRYADDTAILAHDPGSLKNKLEALRNFCEVNKLRVNVEKTKIMIFSKSGRIGYTK